MLNDSPKCFANYQNEPRCSSCVYLESCKFCTTSQNPDTASKTGQVSYDRYSFSRKVASEAITENTENYEHLDTQKVLEFLLDLDNYTAELLHAVLHSDCNSTSDLAKEFDVSRQAIHRKLIDCCTLHPELRKLFIARLPRCRRILTSSRRISTTPKKHNNNQMELF